MTQRLDPACLKSTFIFPDLLLQDHTATQKSYEVSSDVMFAELPARRSRLYRIYVNIDKALLEFASYSQL